MGSVSVRDLEKSYAERRKRPRGNGTGPTGCGLRFDVLKDICLDIEDGEFVCVLGPSGCGKSTLLRLMAGFDTPSGGEIRIDGRPVRGPSRDHIFVFQESALLPWMTIRENVGLGLRHMKRTPEWADMVEEYLEMVDLCGTGDRYPHQLSGGMQRRAELARALAVNPDMLFLDEPFTGLDFLTHMKMREEVVNVHDYIRKTMILVTHDIDDALIMGDRIIVLGGRPSRVVLSRRLDFDRPRDFRKNAALNDLRNEVFLMLGVNYAV